MLKVCFYDQLSKELDASQKIQKTLATIDFRL